MYVKPQFVCEILNTNKITPNYADWEHFQVIAITTTNLHSHFVSDFINLIAGYN